MSMRGSQGTVTLWLLGLCLLLFALGGISLDLWRSFSERRALVATADAAALAGASAV
ncbi:MAG: pilus assembly protein TadG-related protein, partial [Candidatus Eisenbacteria bacterium]